MSIINNTSRLELMLTKKEMKFATFHKGIMCNGEVPHSTYQVGSKSGRSHDQSCCLARRGGPACTRSCMVSMTFSRAKIGASSVLNSPPKLEGNDKCWPSRVCGAGEVLPRVDMELMASEPGQAAGQKKLVMGSWKVPY